MKLDSVAPLGRSLAEYSLMFDLSHQELSCKIVGIGDGPASFNAEMNCLNFKVVSVDPIYVFSANEIKNQFERVIKGIISQIKQTPEDWVWGFHKSPENLESHRVEVINNFADDFELGKKDQRYIVGELPQLGFEDGQFDLALCSHFLFLYSENFDIDFHEKSIREMVRIAGEVRIFPLLDLANNRSKHIDPIISMLKTQGYDVEIRKVHYELQRGGNEMLRIRKA